MNDKPYNPDPNDQSTWTEHDRMRHKKYGLMPDEDGIEILFAMIIGGAIGIIGGAIVFVLVMKWVFLQLLEWMF